MSLRVLVLCLLGLAAACSKREREPTPAPQQASEKKVALVDLRRETLSHPAPYIPPQCYTKTQDERGGIHNPCFVCHQSSRAPNYIDDDDVQLAYALPEPAMRNPWTNLFVDRRAAVAAVPDEDILAYVRQSNYFAEDGSLTLARTLRSLPETWDVNGNGTWDGWVPDIHFRFDGRGFDLRPDGSFTGWRALAYYPLPGTFWPTNGSFGDVLIRLPEAFRQDASGRPDADVYVLNLAILEALIATRDVPISPVDEKKYGVDLDGDGRLGRAEVVRYVWRPHEGRRMSWVGRAHALEKDRDVRASAGLFPVGTEFAHAVYYLDVRDGKVAMAPRMKELRYMVKKARLTYGELELAATEEMLEAVKRPEATRLIKGNPERGAGNRAGWLLQAFIEDEEGALRPQTLEEHAFCVGCHSGVGATDDSVFSFGRKLPSTEFQAGWFHWTQRGLEGLREPRRADGQYEYSHYLAQNGAGDEFRSNEEVLARFFTRDGKLKAEAVTALRGDIGTLLLPSAGRALALDKAYRLIVREQGFIRGRDATLAPVQNVHRDLSAAEEEVLTGVLEPVAGPR